MNVVADFEKAFASYVGAKHGIALCNGTATLHTGLVALGVQPGDKVAVPPLTMAATTLAVLHAGAEPVFVDVDPGTWTWLMNWPDTDYRIGVSLYGLAAPHTGGWRIDDAAQTLRQHGGAAFTSYSFQASKILPLGEGGMLVTDDDDLAQRAREFSSLGYRMPDGPNILKARLKHPEYARHHSIGWNYRMSKHVACHGLYHFGMNQEKWWMRDRLECAEMYKDVVQGCDWLTPQHIPEGWTHDYWAYAVATDTPERALWLLDAMERYGGERPYPAWLLTYREPALKYLVDDRSANPPFIAPTVCPVAERLQPRLVQFQTNDLRSAEKNAQALKLAIAECT